MASKMNSAIVVMCLTLLVIVALAFRLSEIVSMPGRPFKGPLPELTDVEIASAQDLHTHVNTLAGEIGERNWRRPDKLEAAAGYIEDSLKKSGYEAIEKPSYELNGRQYSNLQVELKGRARSDEIVIVGAHYDSVVGSPGANDNASGVAAVIEIARALARDNFNRTVRFVLFVNEEPPFFHTEDMGSHHYARRCKERGEKVVAMLSLETIGYYSDKAKSQQYPAPFNLLYPDTGNFIAFVANDASRQLVHRCLIEFRQAAHFPSEGIAAPEWIQGVDWSDQLSFWKQGYPGVMITDTALFRYPYYHTAEDTPEKIDYERTARVVSGLTRVVSNLAEAVNSK